MKKNTINEIFSYGVNHKYPHIHTERIESLRRDIIKIFVVWVLAHNKYISDNELKKIVRQTFKVRCYGEFAVNYKNYILSKGV